MHCLPVCVQSPREFDAMRRAIIRKARWTAFIQGDSSIPHSRCTDCPGYLGHFAARSVSFLCSIDSSLIDNYKVEPSSSFQAIFPVLDISFRTAPSHIFDLLHTFSTVNMRTGTFENQHLCSDPMRTRNHLC